MLALRGRIATRRGDRAAAVGYWQAAARHGIQENVPLFAWCAGRECGGEEGEHLMKEACASMGREPDVVLQEFLKATAEEPETGCKQAPLVARSHRRGSML